MVKLGNKRLGIFDKGGENSKGTLLKVCTYTLIRVV